MQLLHYPKQDIRESMAEDVQRFLYDGGQVRTIMPQSDHKPPKPTKPSQSQAGRLYRKYLRELEREGRVIINF